MLSMTSNEVIPTKVSWRKFVRKKFRILKAGDPPRYLYSSFTHARFDLIYLSPNRKYAEYNLHDPGSLFGYDSEEELMVLLEDGKWIAYYGGIRFWDEQFSFQRGEIKHGKL